MPPEDTAAPAPAAAPNNSPESDDDIIASITQGIADAKDDKLAAEDDDDTPAADKPNGKSKLKVDDDEDADEVDPDLEDSADGESEDDEETDPDLPSNKRLEQANALLEGGDLDGALKAAFGKDAAYFKIDSGKWANYRSEIKRDKLALRAQQAQIEAKARDFQAEVRQTVQQLQPAADLIKIQSEFAQNRDYASLIKLCEGITGEQWDVINKNCLKGAKRSPEALRIQQQLDALREEIKKRDQQAEQQKQQLTQEQIYTRDLETIRTQLGKHAVRKIPNFEKRVYNVLVKTKDPHIGLTLSMEEAAARVIRGERKRVEQSKWLLEGKKPKATTEPEPEPKDEPKGRKSGTTLLRRDSQANGAARKDESDDEIIRDIQRQVSRGNVAKRKRAS